MTIPNKYKNKIKSIEQEAGLIDDCKYMVYLNDGIEHDVFGDSFPIKNSKELKNIMEDIEWEASTWVNH